MICELLKLRRRIDVRHLRLGPHCARERPRLFTRTARVLRRMPAAAISPASAAMWRTRSLACVLAIAARSHRGAIPMSGPNVWKKSSSCCLASQPVKTVTPALICRLPNGLKYEHPAVIERGDSVESGKMLASLAARGLPQSMLDSGFKGVGDFRINPCLSRSKATISHPSPSQLASETRARKPASIRFQNSVREDLRLR